MMSICPAGAAETSAGFALIELFASEGCSSCPPADDLLRDLVSQSQKNHKKVFALSFQVDYWNQLGWKDPFSSNQFTQRQYQYANVLATSSVYTPQMIINGQDAFVGSDGRRAQEGIDKYLKVPAYSTLTLQVEKIDTNHLKIKYEANPIPEDSVIHFAFVEGGLESQVTAGENGGRTLKHENIVREFKTMDLKQASGEVELILSSEYNFRKSSIIVYIQRTIDMKIFGAQQVRLEF